MEIVVILEFLTVMCYSCKVYCFNIIAMKPILKLLYCNIHHFVNYVCYTAVYLIQCICEYFNILCEPCHM